MRSLWAIWHQNYFDYPVDLPIPMLLSSSAFEHLVGCLSSIPVSLAHHSVLIRTSHHAPPFVLSPKQLIGVTYDIVTGISRYLSQEKVINQSSHSSIDIVYRILHMWKKYCLPRWSVLNLLHVPPTYIQVQIKTQLLHHNCCHFIWLQSKWYWREHQDQCLYHIHSSSDQPCRDKTPCGKILSPWSCCGCHRKLVFSKLKKVTPLSIWICIHA